MADSASEPTDRGGTTGENDGSDGDDGDTANMGYPDLQAEVAVLREENERLRAAYASAKRTHHRQTALGFAVLGVLALAGAAILPEARTVLLALGGTGLFAALLTVYLTPERFVAASVGRSVYEAMADSEAAVASELGLAEERVYVPVGEGDDVRLFVPQRADADLPPADALADAFVVPQNGSTPGLALQPTGAALVDEFERAASGGLPSTPSPLARGLREALLEQFELLEAASVDVEPGRVTLAASDSAFGPCYRFDHPVQSVLACGLARGLDEPVTVTARASEDDRADWQITCRWEAEQASENGTETDDASETEGA